MTKIVIVGCSNVGKTCLIQSASHMHFSSQIEPTKFPKFTSLEIKNINKTGTTLFQIWDTPGKNAHRRFLDKYFENTFAIIIVYAIDDIKSFKCVRNYLDYLNTIIQTPFELFLVGNKKDNINSREVTEEAGISMGIEINANFYEVSAKTNEGIEELFNKIIEILDSKEKPKQKQKRKHYCKLL